MAIAPAFPRSSSELRLGRDTRYGTIPAVSAPRLPDVRRASAPVPDQQSRLSRIEARTRLQVARSGCLGASPGDFRFQTSMCLLTCTVAANEASLRRCPRRRPVRALSASFPRGAGRAMPTAGCSSRCVKAGAGRAARHRVARAEDRADASAFARQRSRQPPAGPADAARPQRSSLRTVAWAPAPVRKAVARGVGDASQWAAGESTTP